MIKLRILIFLFLFCILQECKILHAARMKPGMSNVCVTPECKNAASIIRDYIDPTIAPCDDFYEFACGTFIKKTEIPKNKTFFNRDEIIQEKAQEQLKISIEEPIKSTEPRWAKLTKNFYKACMNTTAIEKNSLPTILGQFKKLGGWPVLEGDSWKEENFDWKQTTYNMRKLGYVVDYFFSFESEYINSTNSMLSIDQPIFGVDRENLVNGINETNVKAYYNYMVETAVSFGAKRAAAEKELKESLEFEIELAKISTSAQIIINENGPSKSMTVKELTKKYPSIPWKEYFNSILKTIVIDDNEKILVSDPNFFEKFETLMKETRSKRVLANYLFWRGAEQNLQYLTEEIRNRKTKFVTLLTGQDQKVARWKQCIEATSEGFSSGVGALYVRKYFNPESKKSAEKLAADIEQQFKETLKEVDWMDERTRMSASNKLESIKNFVGYPNELLDDKTLDEFYKNVQITPNNYFEAALNISIYLTDLTFNQLRKPVTQLDWSAHSATADINLSYDIQSNSIEIPAGILQDIYFGKDKPQYLNYAVIGASIAHKIISGFNNGGGQYDKNENPENWWTSETNKKFLEKVDCIAKQYGNYTVEEVKLKVNGNQTESENIADNGGAKISYLAYQDWVKRNGPEPKLPGLDYSQSQLFWIQAAIQQCEKYIPNFLKEFVTIGNISPSKFRIIGTVSNRPEFAKDFNCSPGSKMNPVRKCSIW